MKKPILCLDFDGVVHSYTSGWRGPREIPDPPVPGALEFMLDALNAMKPWDVVIHSTRARYWGGISAMRRWLCDNAGTFWWDSAGSLGLQAVRFVRFKPAATVILDDRALTFTGSFPRPEALRSFRPWFLAPKVVASSDASLAVPAPAVGMPLKVPGKEPVPGVPLKEVAERRK